VFKLDKDFIGRNETEASFDSEHPWICAYLEIEGDGVVDGHGGEAVLHASEVVGSTSSVAFGHTVGKVLAFAYLKPHAAEPGTGLEVIVQGERRRARVLGEPAYDPQSVQPRIDAGAA